MPPPFSKAGFAATGAAVGVALAVGADVVVTGAGCGGEPHESARRDVNEVIAKRRESMRDGC